MAFSLRQLPWKQKSDFHDPQTQNVGIIVYISHTYNHITTCANSVRKTGGLGRVISKHSLSFTVSPTVTEPTILSCYDCYIANTVPFVHDFLQNNNCSQLPSPLPFECGEHRSRFHHYSCAHVTN